MTTPEPITTALATGATAVSDCDGPRAATWARDDAGLVLFAWRDPEGELSERGENWRLAHGWDRDFRSDFTLKQNPFGNR